MADKYLKKNGIYIYIDDGLLVHNLEETEGLVESSGPGDAGKIPALNSEGKISSSMIVGGMPSNSVLPETTFDISPTAGIGTTYSRGDHSHGSPSNPVLAHAVLTIGIHGVGGSTVESVAGSQVKVDAHKDLTTGVHGAGAGDALETTTGSQGKVNTHAGAADPHTGYIKHSLATAVSDFLVASGVGVFVKKTLAEVKAILGLGSAAYTATTDYVTHALATTLFDFLVASGSGAFVKKTLAETQTILAHRGGRAYLSVNQTGIPQDTYIKVMLDAESYDSGDFDTSKKSGTASATSANHLVDATLSPFVAGDVGRIVHNTTDDTYATITVYNSASDVTLSADIMVLGETYEASMSRFTATQAGYYLMMGVACWTVAVETFTTATTIRINGSTIANATQQGRSYGGAFISDVQYLNVGDYVELFCYQETGATKALYGHVGYTFLMVRRLY